MPRFNPRDLMDDAVVAMGRSVPESRADGKASPLVGAILWKSDGTVESACRGELRDGDHAEYALLERKNRDKRLDDAKLFVTLEPCAPGSRTHPKSSCAERIVRARIKEVWVGIEDPDPMVDRKGIKYLQDHGVTVHMFDRDLQERIRSMNKKFLEQALERAAAMNEDEEPQAVTLSPLENAFAAAETKDFSTDALKQYQTDAQIGEAVDSPAFNRRLAQQGLLKQENGKSAPTGFGLLLFGKEPRTAMPQAGLLGTIHYADGTEELNDFDGPQVLAPSQALQWLRDKLPNPIDRSTARRQQMNDSLFKLVREGVVNAIVHRDYSITGAKCHLIVTPDTIVVKSPGKPVEPISVEQMQHFDAPMLSRNPILHHVFARMELAEERGLGLKSMKANAETIGLPLPKYAWKDPYLVLTLYRNSAAAAKGLEVEVAKELTKAERLGWEWLATKDRITTAEYQLAMKLPNRTAKNHLKKFTDLGLLKMVGAGRATRYLVVR